MEANMVSRREFLKVMGFAACGVAGSGLPALVSPVMGAIDKERVLSFDSLRTGEKLDVTYWSRGEYSRRALHEVDHLLRDWRTNEVHSIDPALLDLLFAVRRKLDTTAPFRVISGYRSPATNAKLARRGRGVARKSLHMMGKAIDVAIPGVQIRALRNVALSLERGGVGYYPRSGFIHLDTGRVRRW